MKDQNKTKAELIAELDEIHQRVSKLEQLESDQVQVKKELIESERKSRTWLENSPVCTKIVDLDFNLQYMSSSGVRELKIDDISEYYGTPYPFHFYPDSFKIPMNSNLRKAKETGVIIVQVASVVDTDGNDLWYHSTIVPVYDEEDQLDYIMVVSLEITERVRAQETLRLSEALLSKSQQISKLGSWELDLATTRLIWSDQVYHLFGLQPQEFDANYEAFLAAIHPDDRAAVDAAYTDSLRDGSDGYEIEHRIVRHDNGEVRIVYEKCDHIKDAGGQIIRSVGMVQDITERKQVEKELEKHREHLEDLVAERTTKLQKSNEELRRFALLAADREIRMKELREENVALREKLKN